MRSVRKGPPEREERVKGARKEKVRMKGEGPRERERNCKEGGARAIEVAIFALSFGLDGGVTASIVAFDIGRVSPTVRDLSGL